MVAHDVLDDARYAHAPSSEDTDDTIKTVSYIGTDEDWLAARYANKQATTKLPRYTQSVAWLHSVHLLCTRQSVYGAYRDHYTNKLNKLSYGKNKRNEIVS